MDDDRVRLNKAYFCEVLSHFSSPQKPNHPRLQRNHLVYLKKYLRYELKQVHLGRGTFLIGDSVYDAAHFSQFFDDSTIVMIATGVSVKITGKNEIQL